jgi:DNA-binding response OmpR family regulator
MGELVLIVDDSTRFLRSARAILEADGGRIETATDLATGLALARTLHPDVMLVDVQLGSESGLDLVRRMRDEGPRDVPVILISTHDLRDIEGLLPEGSVAGYLPKAALSMGAIRRLTESGR